MPIYQHNQTNLDFLHNRAGRVGYPVIYGLIKFLTSHGVEDGMARKVAARIYRKAQRNRSLTTEETYLVEEYKTKASGKTTVTSQVVCAHGDRRNKLSDNNSPIPARNMVYKEGGFNAYVHKPPAGRKSPPMIRQLAHHIDIAST